MALEQFCILSRWTFVDRVPKTVPLLRQPYGCLASSTADGRQSHETCFGVPTSRQLRNIVLALAAKAESCKATFLTETPLSDT